MLSYLTHGLYLTSEWALPDGVEQAPDWTGPFDVCVTQGKVTWPEVLESNHDGFVHTPKLDYFYWPSLGKVSISASGDVVIEPRDDVAEGLVGHVITGPILAHLLLLAGKLPFHANCVNVNDRLIGVVGSAGAGKSSLCAAMVEAGAVPYCDDIVGLDPRTGLVSFGTSRFKLNQDVMTHLGMDPEAYTRVYQSIDKRSVPYPLPPTRTALPLVVLYRLTDRSDGQMQIHELDSVETVMMMMNEIFRPEIARRTKGLQALFEMCSLASQHVAGLSLSRKKNLLHLRELARFVLKDAAQR